MEWQYKQPKTQGIDQPRTWWDLAGERNRKKRREEFYKKYPHFAKAWEEFTKI